MTLTEYYWTLEEITNDLKYLMRLSSRDFQNLLFPHTVDKDSVRGKWVLFAESPLHFIWSCSMDKLEIISQYIQDCKREKHD